MTSSSEENYLKTILSVNLKTKRRASTNAIAQEIGTSPASVSDMLRKLQYKNLIKYKKYQWVELTKSGKKIAINIIRKHRLWETFLVKKLNFTWDEVHEVAEQLEHIKSVELIDRLDSYLKYPEFDPHGEPIPSQKGLIPTTNTITLNELNSANKGTVMGVKTDEKSFLHYLTRLNINIGSEIEVMEKIDFDKSLSIKVKEKHLHISTDVAKQILIKKT